MLHSKSRRPAAQPGGSGDGAKAAAVVFGFLAAILVPAVLALRTVREGAVHVPSPDPTPFGYTVSLLIYFVPILALSAWFMRSHPAGSRRYRAFVWTLGLLVPVGFLLDIVFGNLFFLFPNRLATLGIDLPGFSFETWSFEWNLPIEEFAFYVSGFVAILMVYVWCCDVWVPAYGVDDYDDTSVHPPYMVRLHLNSLFIGLGLVAAAAVYKKMFAPVGYRDGFPLYFTFLVVAAVGPSMLLYRSARPFINWRAFSVTLLWVLLTSLLWEATLASPYEWWRYRPEMMMGIHIKAWAGLPVEAALLWVAVTFTTTIVYETIIVLLHLRTPTMMGALFGTRQSG